jgi:hypothetical protein
MIFLLSFLFSAHAVETAGNLDIFAPDPNAYRYFSISSANILRPNTIHLSTDAYYWYSPSSFYNNRWNDLDAEERIVSFYGVAYAPLEKWSLCMSAPFLNNQELDSLGSSGIGDILLQAKYGVLNKEFSLVKLALASDVTLPSGDIASLTGNQKITFYPSMILEFYSQSSRVRWATELGYYLPRDDLFFTRGYKVGTAASYQLNKSVELLTEYQRYSSVESVLISNVVGSIRYSWKWFRFQGAFVVPLDADLGLSNIQYNLGVGFIPSWEYRSRDEDRDSIPNKADLCPDIQEDFDGFQDEDGCPEPDNDQDGILDLQDECRLEKEDIDGFQDEDGCLDMDNDKDNILDFSDRCPNKAETINGYRDLDGCPDHSFSNDYDGDHFQDNKDKCPFLAEDFDGFQDEDGCPEIDNDNDGILDENDEHPLDADTVQHSLESRMEEQQKE